MSLVGPRPERPEFVAALNEQIDYHLRHAVRPGITGWAQILYKYGSSVEDAKEKLRYDLYYIKNSSWGWTANRLKDDQDCPVEPRRQVMQALYFLQVSLSFSRRHSLERLVGRLTSLEDGSGNSHVIMGFALTIVYIVVTIISPEQFGKAWASYHALMYLAGVTALASLPSMATYKFWKTSVQTFLLLGFIGAISLSELANGWLGGVLESWRIFLPSAAVFFFIIVNVTTIS